MPYVLFVEKSHTMVWANFACVLACTRFKFPSVPSKKVYWAFSCLCWLLSLSQICAVCTSSTSLRWPHHKIERRKIWYIDSFNWFMHLRIKICYFHLWKFRKWLSLTKIFTSASVVRESSSVSQLPVVTHKSLMNYPKLCLHLFRFFGWPRRKAGRQKNWSTDSFNCSPPRKSLVKGERFMRDEGKPEWNLSGK